MKRTLFAVPLALLLGGCPPITLKTVTLSPTQLNSSVNDQWAQNAWCSVPNGGGFLNGLGPPPVSPPEIYSGYDDIFDKGAEPFPCEYEQQNQLRGQVQFDISMFNSIADATLTFNVDSSYANATIQTPAIGVATVLGMSTGQSRGDNGPIYWNYDNPASLPSCQQGVIKPDCSVDVSSQARAWDSSAHPNNGFILAGPVLTFPSNLPQDNNNAVSYYSGFQLQVTYNPSLNPNAPQ